MNRGALACLVAVAGGSAARAGVTFESVQRKELVSLYGASPDLSESFTGTGQWDRELSRSITDIHGGTARALARQSSFVGDDRITADVAGDVYSASAGGGGSGHAEGQSRIDAVFTIDDPTHYDIFFDGTTAGASSWTGISIVDSSGAAFFCKVRAWYWYDVGTPTGIIPPGRYTLVLNYDISVLGSGGVHAAQSAHLSVLFAPVPSPGALGLLALAGLRRRR